LYYLGRWDAARAELAEVQALGDVLIAAVVPYLEHRLAGRREAEAAGWLDAWERFEPDLDFELLGAIAKYAAEALLAIGHYAQVRDRLDAMLTRVRATGAVTYEVPLAPLWAEALAQLEDPCAAAVCEAALALTQRLGARHQEAQALRARAWVRRAAGDWTSAFADCDAAFTLLDQLGIAWEAAQALKQLGLLRLARGRRGDRERARIALEAARERFNDIGSSREVAEVAVILTRAGLSDPASDAGPLSPRESEVAILTARGLTNRQIAEQLFITEKTAAHHVSAILTKLGLGSRVEVAAYVARQG
jgi:DNA-binding CsgD family transcriptional regulator